MPDILQKIILGVIQGLTEFLPVSSSGHLELVKVLIGDQTVGEEGLLTTVTLHFATALATIVVFRRDIASILRNLFNHRDKQSLNFVWFIFLSMLPAAIVGVFLEDKIEQLFLGNILLVGICLIVTALLLILADRQKKTDQGVTSGKALLIGLAQAVAILPGISRSGATISTSVLLNIDRSQAARFSFLMVIPLIFGKIALDLIQGDFAVEQSNFVSLGAGFVAAFVTGIVACQLMIRLVQNSKLSWFALYCLIVGLAAVILSVI